MSKPAIIRIHEAHIPNEQKSDDVLISLFQNGQKEVFRFLVERYQERMRNLIYSIFKENGIVDDLAQEVFIKVYEALPKFRFESSFYTWLYRIAVNKSRDELRKRKVKRFFSLQAMMETSDKVLEASASYNHYDFNVGEVIESGLQKLPEKFRIPVILKDVDGFSYEEMAEIMDCEIGTVKSRLSRGRAMLRIILQPLMEN